MVTHRPSQPVPASHQPANPYAGLLLIDKPLGITSMDALRVLRRGLAAAGAKVRGKGPGKVRTGHAGTLDPLATGLLIACIGKATRSVEQLMGLPKQYLAEIDLTAFTTTDDREGDRNEVHVHTPPTRDDIDQACQKFLGDIQQTPPAYSAIHVDGRRAYDLARRGKAVELKSRTVRIDAIEITDYHWPLLTLQIDCGKGTYIRSLARDLGQALNTGGHLASLRRTQIGPYRVDQAVDIQRCEAPIHPEDLLPMPSASAQPSDGKAGSR
ncbi:tRNA pseudouridine(55) synthase TruB [Mucisphaera sp.]|uniref:tRNA pseudouridine(55) synthase TruB n=1 Tax=Mucisphaera sp. TaxID=2913024 RepID=UPI003D0B9CAE